MQTETREAGGVTTPGVGWRRVGVGAGLVMGIWSVGLQIVLGAVIPPVLVVGILFVALAVVFGRVTKTWAKAATAIVPLVALAANLPPIVFDLAHPEEGVVFTLTVVSVVGGLLMSLAGFMVWFDRHSSATPAVAVGVGAVAVAAAVGLVSASGVESVSANPGDAEVETRSVQFAPSEIVLAADAGGVWVDNVDPFAHTFTVEGTDIDLHVPGTSAQRLDIDLAPGTYSVFCAVPGHESMTATLLVEG